MISFKEFFNSRKIILFDGATGSNLLSQESLSPLPDLLSLKRPELVESLHEAYLEAGSDVIETNSFCSNPVSFETSGISENAFDCAKAAAKLAGKAADRFSTDEKPRFVAGSIGPIFTKDFLPEQNKELLFKAFQTQISALLEGGADLLVFETFQDTVQAEAALSAAFETAEKLKKKIPVILSISGKNGKTHTGTPFEQFAKILSKFDLSAFGLNCESFDETMHDAAIIRKISKIPLILMPNLGLPEKIDGKFVYKTAPAEFAGKMTEIIGKYGPKIVGGCCGTTPEHIKALKPVKK